MEFGKILIVEDEAVFALDLNQRLTQLGYQVVALAVTGEEAIAFAEEHQPDLVLMDIRLGGKVDGIQATLEIQKNNDVPVIFITANTDNETIDRAKLARPASYLIKPIKDKELSTTIELSLYRHRAEKAERQQQAIANVMHQVASALNSTLNLEQVIDHLLDNLGNIVQHDAAEVILLEQSQPHLKRQRQYLIGSDPQADPSIIDAASTPLVPQEHLQSILDTSKALVVGQIQPSLSTAYPTLKLRSLAGVPICLKNEIIGFLIVFSKHANAFGEDALAHLHAFSDQTATAINNARQFTALQQYNEDLEELVRQRTAKLQEISGRLEAILDSSPDAIVIFWNDGTLEKVNPMFHTLFGYTPEDISEPSFSLLTGFSDTTQIGKALDQINSSYKVQRLELKARHKDSREFDADIALGVIYEGDREAGVVCTIRDVSEYKRIESELARARDEAIAAKDFRSRLLAMVSHDLRTPITAIQGYCTLLQMDRIGALNQTQNEYITRIKFSAESLTGLVSNLVDQAQLEAGKIILDNAPFTPQSLLESVELAVIERANSKGLSLVLTAEDLPESLIGDLKRLSQITINLVANSIKFTREGEVRVLLNRSNENYWSIEVQDTGTGIPPEAQERIFEAFEQARNNLDHDTWGVGLGLSIAKQLTELMNGQIELTSEVNKGTIVNVRLPLIEAEG